MIRILDRYFLREVLVTATAVMSVLLLTVIGNILARLLGRTTEGRLPVDVLFPLVGLGAARIFILLIPFAVFLAIMMSMGRLYRDSEMTALRASGIGYRQLYRPLSLLGVVLVPALIGLSFITMPTIEQASDRIKTEVQERSELSGISPGRFIESNSAGRVVFIESLTEDKSAMRNVFVHFDNHGRSSVVTATRAEQVIDPDTGERYLELKNGYRFEGVAGEAQYRIAEFEAYGVLVPRVKSEGRENNRGAYTTKALWNSGTAKDMAELHWRLAVPISLVVLIIVALPLSYTSPRQGRFGKLTVGILVYVIYANLLIVGQSWIDKGRVSPAFGLWWVHALVLVLALVLITRQYGWRWVSWPRAKGRTRT